MKTKFVRPVSLAVSFSSLMAALAFSGRSSGREVRAWEYDELISESEAVVIVRCEEHLRTEESAPAELVGKRFVDDFKKVIDSLRVVGVLKGKMKLREEIKLVQYSEFKANALQNGPEAFAFELLGPIVAKDLKGKGIRGDPPEYLIFIRSRSDGTYELVSGFLDAERSVRRLNWK
jgi:hypothetical protein